MKRSIGAALLAAVLLSAAPVAAQQTTFEEAVAAYDRGDFAEAVRIWTPLARRGDVAAQFNLGLMYEKGRGVPADAERAAQWYLSAAESGHAKSAFNLGVMHSRGAMGPDRNLDEAGRWLGVAAEKGIAQAQYLYALLLADRDYKGMNPNLADQWMRRAADAGYGPARQHLATQTASAPPAAATPAPQPPPSPPARPAQPAAAPPPAPVPAPVQTARPPDPPPQPARLAASSSAEAAETRPTVPILPGRGQAATAPAATTEPALSIAAAPSMPAPAAPAPSPAPAPPPPVVPPAALAPPPAPAPAIAAPMVVPPPAAIAVPPPTPAPVSPPAAAPRAAPPAPRPPAAAAVRPSTEGGWRSIFSSRDPGFRPPEGELSGLERANRPAPILAGPSQPDPPRAAAPPRPATAAPPRTAVAAPPPTPMPPAPVVVEPAPAPRPMLAMAPPPPRGRPGYVTLQTEIAETYRAPPGPRNYRVWLAVVENEAQARWEWERLLDRHPGRLVAVAADAELVINERSQPAWRIYAGHFDTMAAASAFCAELRLDDRMSRCLPYLEPN